MRRRATTGQDACSRRLLRGGVQGWSERLSIGPFTEEHRRRFRRRRCVVVQRLADVRALGGSFVGECKDGTNQRLTCASGACVLYAKEPFKPMN